MLFLQKTMNSCHRTAIVAVAFFSFLSSSCFSKTEDSKQFERAYTEWSEIIHSNSSSTRGTLVFVDGPLRSYLGKNALRHKDYIIKKLNDDPFVCLILAECHELNNPDQLKNYGIELGSVSKEQQLAWIKFLSNF